ncbi:protein PFC0760c-like isoform X2 [Myxocyprinus asiaticus]|uniref:protein PFC0760c-like isoform X2 n=1 Tax=Myxocyprinus asiaticus TaxID=70543 RepID=UPI0022225695|nr:protein PFC0760c-like isoform X2 [Myxocyprinus asiaticus]
MKAKNMTALWKVLCFFICLTLTRFDSGICVIYVESGKSGNLNPNIQGKPEDILWTFNGNKAAEHDLFALHEYGQFKERTEIDISTGHLTVHQMNHSDSGVYKSTIQIKGILHLSTHDVQVIDAVPEPSVTCKVNRTTELKSLFCSVDSQFPATYEWIGSNAAHQSEQELHIGKEENPDSVYTCIVKNQVSHKKNSFTLKDCNTDGSKLALKISLPIIIIIIIIITGIITVYLMKKRKDKMSRVQGEESMELLPQLPFKSGFPENHDESSPSNNGSILRRENEETIKMEMSDDRGESMDENEGTDGMNKDKEPDTNSGCADDEHKKYSQDQSEQIHESDVNQSNSNDAEQNSEQEKSEYEDESVHNHEGAERINEDKQSESGKNAKCSEDNEEDINKDNLHEQTDESANNGSILRRENEETIKMEMSDDRGESMDENEGTDGMNKDKEPDTNSGCADDEHKKYSQDQSEQIHESDVNQSNSKDAEQNSEQEKSEYEDESVHNHEGAERINEDKQSESGKNAKCSEDNEEDINKDNLHEQTDESANNGSILRRENEETIKMEMSDDRGESMDENEGTDGMNKDKEPDTNSGCADDEHKKYSQDQSEQIHESDVNQSNSNDAEQNSEQEKSEYEDESVHNHEGAERINEDKQSESGKNAKCSEDNEEDINKDNLHEQTDESANNGSILRRENEETIKMEMSDDRGESMDENEGTDGMNKDKEPDTNSGCADDEHKKYSQDQSEQIHESDVNQSNSNDAEQNSEQEKSEYEDESVHNHEGAERINEDKQSESGKNAKCSEDNEEDINKDNLHEQTDESANNGSILRRENEETIKMEMSDDRGESMDENEGTDGMNKDKEPDTNSGCADDEHKKYSQDQSEQIHESAIEELNVRQKIKLFDTPPNPK